MCVCVCACVRACVCERERERERERGGGGCKSPVVRAEHISAVVRPQYMIVFMFLEIKKR